MPNKNLIWKYLRSLERLYSIYENDLKEDNLKINQRLKILKSFINKNEFSKFNFEETKRFCIGEWEKIIKKIIDKLINIIQNRKTRGSEFAGLIFQLTKLNEDIDIEDYDLENYEKMYEEDLKTLKSQIFEKIKNESYQKSNFIKGILLGAIIGFILGIFSNLVYEIIKYLF